jgi:hypothetical protein
MINDTVVHSLKHLWGLSPAAPIFITVDGLPDARVSTDDTKRLAQYVRGVTELYLC